MLRTIRSPLLYLVLAATTFFSIVVILNKLVPWPAGLGLEAKMEYFAAHKDEFDTLFIGSSRSVRGLDNRRIEARLAEAGVPMRSFNLAVGGMRSFEQDYYLHEILAMQPANLKTIFFEGGPVGMGQRPDHVFRDPPNLATARGVYWHSPRETRNVLESLQVIPLPTRKKIDFAMEHMMLCAWKVSNYGKGEAFLRRTKKIDADVRERERIWGRFDEGGGHTDLETASGKSMAPEMKELLIDSAPFDERMALVASENALPVSLDEVNVEVYRAQYRAVEALGIELIYYIPPGYEGSPERLRLSEAGEIPILLQLNDPERYPALFRLDHRYDKGHLNRRGAALFSDFFAEALLESGARMIAQTGELERQ